MARQKRSFFSETVLPILILLALLLAVKGYKYCQSSVQSSTVKPSRSENTIQNSPSISQSGSKRTSRGNVPTYVLDVLEYVTRHGEAPKGYVGGRTFSNREKRLPRASATGEQVKYQEWDVHPKVQGKNRGAERLVTGSDQSAYYTSDHYQTFQKIE